MWRPLSKQTVALVVIERNHLIRPGADDATGVAAAIVVSCVHAHAGTRHAVFAECDAGGDAALFKGSILFIQIELVGLRVIGNQNVGPAIAVVIENGYAQTLRSRVAEPGFGGGIFKLPSPKVMPQPQRCALLRPRRTLALAPPPQHPAHL